MKGCIKGKRSELLYEYEQFLLPDIAADKLHHKLE